MEENHIKMFVGSKWHYFIRMHLRGCRDGSVVKSTDCSSNSLAWFPASTGWLKNTNQSKGSDILFWLVRSPSAHMVHMQLYRQYIYIILKSNELELMLYRLVLFNNWLHGGTHSYLRSVLCSQEVLGSSEVPYCPQSVFTSNLFFFF